MADIPNAKEMVDIMGLNENKGYQWAEESALYRCGLLASGSPPKGILCAGSMKASRGRGTSSSWEESSPLPYVL